MGLLLLAALVFFLWKSYNFPPPNPANETYRMIAADPVQVAAFVVKTGSHMSRHTRMPDVSGDEFKYQFKVDGKVIEGNLDGFQEEGKMVTVTYNKANPSLNCLGSPADHIEQRSWSGFVLTTVLALMVGGMFFFAAFV